MVEYTLEVSGMMCMNCVKHVKEALEKVKGVKEAQVSLETKKAIVKCKDSVSKDLLIKSIADAGYEAK